MYLYYRNCKFLICCFVILILCLCYVLSDIDLFRIQLLCDRVIGLCKCICVCLCEYVHMYVHTYVRVCVCVCVCMGFGKCRHSITRPCINWNNSCKLQTNAVYHTILEPIMLLYLNIKYFDNKNCHNSIHKQTKFIHVSNDNGNT